MGIDALVSLLVYIIVIGAVCWLLWWLIGFLGLPQPFDKIARGLVAIVAVLLLISLLLGIAGHPLGLTLHR